MTELLIGHIVGKYRIEDKLGEGGMGVVYKATDLTLERPVALKILLAEITQDQKTRDRLRQEARALARFNHPNIAILYEFDEVNDFLAMEFIEGETVDKLIRKEGPLKPQRIKDIMKQVLPALSMAHKAGIIHRDIKPSNIMVTPHGTVKIMDFGIAKISGSGAQTVSTGRIVGSFLYISPEQIEHNPVDARTDIYSLGATLYEMATGHLPFETENHFLLMKAHIEEAPSPPSLKYSGVPPALEKVILKALEKQPEDRFQSAEEMLGAIETVPLKKEKMRVFRLKGEKGGPAFSLKRIILTVGVAAVLLTGLVALAVKFFSRPGELNFRSVPPPGTLVLTSLPSDAVLKIDDTKREYPPDGLTLPEGEYQISVELEGRTIWQQAVQIVSGKNKKMTVEFPSVPAQPPSVPEKGSIALTTDPANAEAFLDDEAIKLEGAFPVAAGHHRLRLAAADYRDTIVEFEAAAGEKKNFGVVRLPGLAQWIVLKSVPLGARVLLNGEPVDYTGQKLEVVSGTHTVSIQTPKRVEFTQQVKVASGKPVTVTYSIPKGKLSLKAIPYATFFINGQATNRSGPSFDTVLEAGSYDIRFKHPGFGKEPLQFDTAVFVGDASQARVQHIFKPKK